MKSKSKIKLLGTLKIELVYPSGERVVHLEQKNVIALTAKQVLLSFLYLSGVTSDPINTLWIGTGGTIDSGGQFPKPVSQSLTGLFDPLLSVATTYTVNNTDPSVTFIATIPEASAVGDLITEAGLFTASGAFFNIRTFPGIPKTSEFSIYFSWTIEMQ